MYKYFIPSFLIFFVASSFIVISQFELKLLPATSGLNFSINHLGITDFKGAFTDFDAQIYSSNDQFLDAQITFTAKTASVNTFIEQRDSHLRSADFLDTDNHPEMKFQSTSIKKGKKGSFLVTGDFTLHGVTKSIVVEAKLTGKATNPSDKKELYGLKFTGSLNRLDFGVGSKYPETLLSNQIDFEANLQFEKPLN